MLRLYDILDTASEKAFDDLTRLAASICQTPMSLVSLVDDKRQWFKSRYGLDATETPREVAFCAHAIQSKDVMVIEDAKLDSRFADNPLVTGDPLIRFYAGAPLFVEEGYCLGTLCVIDRRPRKLDAEQLESLALLRDSVVSLLELRRVQKQLRFLQKIVPVCAWCSRVAISNGKSVAWKSADEYMRDIAPASHGMCPTCSSAH